MEHNIINIKGDMGWCEICNEWHDLDDILSGKIFDKDLSYSPPRSNHHDELVDDDLSDDESEENDKNEDALEDDDFEDSIDAEELVDLI